MKDKLTFLQYLWKNGALLYAFDVLSVIISGFIGFRESALWLYLALAITLFHFFGNIISYKNYKKN